MATKLAKIIADFTTQMSTALAVGGTTATLQSATDDDGVSLPSGRYFFTLDGANSSKEHISCDLSGTSLTNIKSVSRQGVETTGVARAHRIGASVTITDFAHIKYINDLLDGTTKLNASSPYEYDATASITLANQLATKAYVDGVAIAGGADASTTVKGITKLSTAPASPTEPIAVGTNDTRVPTQGENDALVGDNTDIAVGTGNKFVTQTGLQHNAEKYAEDTSGSSTAYVITLSPVPTSLTDGMIIHTKIVSANTTTTPTLNVNSLGAKTIKKLNGVALAVGDIGANTHCTFMYDGTDMILQSPVVNNNISGQLGTWASATQGANTQVTTDCLIVGYVSIPNNNTNNTTIATDSSATPTTVRNSITGGSFGTTGNLSFCVPVKKNDYYKITVGASHSVTSYIIPLGI
jgi:hypothetical protein